MMNQRGAITLDFIFGLVLIFSFSAVLFALSFTLSVVEIVQYFTYAAARNYYAGHVSLDLQKKMGTDKYAVLSQNPVFKPLFANGWFTISKDVTLGPSDKYPQPPDSDSDTFTGAQVTFSAPVLKFTVPFFGSTSTQDNGFTSQVATWLMREPNTDECRTFNVQRWQMIQALQSQYGQASTGATGPVAYAVITDNGC